MAMLTYFAVFCANAVCTCWLIASFFKWRQDVPHRGRSGNRCNEKAADSILRRPSGLKINQETNLTSPGEVNTMLRF
jgi:hypothetical protein